MRWLCRVLLERDDLRSRDDFREHRGHVRSRWRGLRDVRRSHSALQQRLVSGGAVWPDDVQRLLPGRRVSGRHGPHRLRQQRERVQHLQRRLTGLQLGFVSGRAVRAGQLSRVLPGRRLSAGHRDRRVWPWRWNLLELRRRHAGVLRRELHRCSVVQRLQLLDWLL